MSPRSTEPRSGRGGVRFLSTKIARRIFALFVLCTLVPLLIFALGSVHEVGDELERQASVRLRHECKAAGLSVIGRLGILTDHLVQLAAREPEQLQEVPPTLADQFDWIVEYDEVPDGPEARARLGGPLSAEEQEHLERFPSLVRVMPAAGGERAFLLVIRSGSGPLATTVFARIHYGHLWGGDAFLPPSGRRQLILSPTGELYFAIGGAESMQQAVLDAVQTDPSSGTLSWDPPEGDFEIVSYRTIFSQPRFRFGYVIARSQPSASVFAPVEGFRSMFGLVGLLTLLLVTGASIHQIRRSMVPIERLREATVRISQGDLDLRVEVESGDELQDLCGAFNDMTARLKSNLAERERIHRELLKARDQALQAAETETRFIHNVSHELRTPLTSIQSASEILDTLRDDEEEVRREFTGVIAIESRRLAGLIGNILDFTAVSSSRGPARRSSTDLADMLRSAVDEAAPLAESRRVRIELDAPGPLVAIVDVERMRMVWSNLLGNAIKFSEPESTVEVRARPGADDIVVEFEDQGPGIAEDDQAVIFERFRQLGDIDIAKPSGTGLGLPIAHQIVQQHEGRIELDSRPGVGSVFRVVLPVHSEAVTAPRPGGSSPAPPGGPESPPCRSRAGA